MSGVTTIFFGSSSTYFMGVWDMATGTTSAYGQGIALGYDAGTAPYAVLAGYTDTGSTGNGFLCRVNSTRETEWDEEGSDSPNRVSAYTVATDSSYNSFGGFSKAGSANVSKFNTAGTLQWQRALSQASSTLIAYGVATDSSGNVAVGGQRTVSPTPRAFLALYNSSGTIQWQRDISATTPSSCSGRCVATDSSGNIYIAGQSLRSGTYGWFVIKYNSSGTLQWQKYSDDASWSAAATVGNMLVDGSGNVYICSCDGNSNLYIVKLNSSGAVQWSRVAAVSTSFTASGLFIDGSGYIYACGSNYLVKVDSSGTGQYDRTFSATTSISITGVIVDNQNAMWIEGTLDATGLPRGVYLARLPNDGTLTGSYVVPYTTSATVTYASAGSILASTTTTWSSASLTDAAGSMTDAAGSITFAAFSNTAYTTAV